jgi:hypothetical protein
MQFSLQHAIRLQNLLQSTNKKEMVSLLSLLRYAHMLS